MFDGLPFRPIVQADESPLSILRRGALGNHRTSTLRFAFSLNPDMDHSPTGLAALARDPKMQRGALSALGIPPTDIDRVAYRRLGKGRSDAVIWNGLTVPIGDLQFRRSKLCIACYRDNGYATCHWDHVAALACPRHRVLLENACPCCGAAWRAETDPLSCGCPIDKMIARQVPCSEAVATTLSRIMESGDSSALRRLGTLIKMLQTWMKLGLTLTREQFAAALADLSRNRWPDVSSTADGITVHPRVALAPLLASLDPGTTATAQSLLAQATTLFRVRQLQGLMWPASTAMAVLGIGRVPFAKIVSAGHLAPDNRGRFNAADLNNLLLQMTGLPDEASDLLSLNQLRSSKHRRSLASLITSIRQGAITRFHSPIAEGLQGLRCAVDIPPPTALPAGITIELAARTLGVNAESVRRLIKFKWLSATRGGADSAVQWRIDPDALAQFQRAYVFASSLASDYQIPSRAVVHRLRHAGAIPVSGPGIDDGATFLFRRDDLACIDLTAAPTKINRTATERRKRTVACERPDLCFGVDVAVTLDLSVRQLREVVSHGLLRPVDRTHRGQRFAIHDVQALRQRLQTDWIQLSMAIQKLSQTTSQFQKTWIDSGIVRAYRFGAQRWVDRSDLESVQTIWCEMGSASSIGRTLGRSRWLCSNLSKMERVAADSRLGSRPHAVRLFRRSNSAWSHYNLNQSPETTLASSLMPAAKYDRASIGALL